MRLLPRFHGDEVPRRVAFAARAENELPKLTGTIDERSFTERSCGGARRHAGRREASRLDARASNHAGAIARPYDVALLILRKTQDDRSRPGRSIFPGFQNETGYGRDDMRSIMDPWPLGTYWVVLILKKTDSLHLNSSYDPGSLGLWSEMMNSDYMDLQVVKDLDPQDFRSVWTIGPYCLD